MPGFPHSFPFIFGLITGSENPQEFPLKFPFAFGLVSGSADLAVEVALSAEMSAIHYAVADLEAQADLWSEVAAAFVGYSENAIFVDATARIGDGFDASLSVAVGSPASLSAQLTIDADLAVTAHGEASGGYGVRGTPTIEVAATAGARLDARASSTLAGTVDLSGRVGDGVTTATAVQADVSGALNVHRNIAANLNIVAGTSAVESRGSNFAAALPVVAGTSTAGNANRLFEANLGAIAGQSAAGRKTVHIAADALHVTVAVTAEMSLGQSVQSSTAVQADTSGEERRGRYGDAHLSALAIMWGEPLVRYAGTDGSLDVTVTLSASMVVNAGIGSDLNVTAILTAHSQLGGTTADRIMLITAELRVEQVEPRESSYLVVDDIRSMPVELRDTVFPVELLDRRMLVEQRT